MYQVRLAVFEGPLDLLLHLIEQQQVDIWQVSMAEIAQQYLDFLNSLPSVELEEAGEYLVMAALLVRIKARHLLPARTVETDPAEEDEEALEAALLARVAEYRRYKEAAAALEQRAAAQACYYTRPAMPSLEPLPPSGPPPGLSAGKLAAAWASLMQRQPPVPPPPPAPRRIHLRSAMGRLLQALRRAGGRLSFRRFLAGRAARWDWIVAFLALLELVRLGRVKVHQPAPLAELDVELSPAAKGAAGAHPQG